MKQNKSESMLFWTTSAQKEWLRRRAEAEDASMSWVIRQAIRDFIVKDAAPDSTLTSLPPLDLSGAVSQDAGGSDCA